MTLVIATFIITAVFVGFHASQESHEKAVGGHDNFIELEVFNNKIIQKIHVSNTEYRSD